jgi:hypothetical protein
MATTKASRPQRAKKKPLPKVSKPEPLIDANEIAKPTSIAAKPLIGADPDYVTTVGLGNLKVTTANGIKNDGKTDV